MEKKRQLSLSAHSLYFHALFIVFNPKISSVRISNIAIHQIKKIHAFIFCRSHSCYNWTYCNGNLIKDHLQMYAVWVELSSNQISIIIHSLPNFILMLVLADWASALLRCWKCEWRERFFCGMNAFQFPYEKFHYILVSLFIWSTK